MILEQVLKKSKNKQASKAPTPTRKKEYTQESTKRSLLKTISWRIVGTLDTILISWLITGTLIFAFSIGAVELFTKMILYYFHERIWNGLEYGK